MDYGKILRRSWDITWNHKFMIVLGFLAGLGTFSSSSGSNSNYQFNEGDLQRMMGPEFAEQAAAFWAAAGVVIMGIICLFMIIGLVLWLLRLTAEAGMIDAASRLDAGQKVTFGEALSAGWHKVGRMVGLNLIFFALFFIFFLIVALIMGLGLAGAIGTSDFGNNADVGGIIAALGFGILTLVCCLMCVFVVIAVIVGILYPFAQRAIVLEDAGVIAGLRRGWQVIKDNLGEVIVLLILFFLIGLAVGAVTFAIFIPLAAISFAPIGIRMFTEGSFEALDIGLGLAGILCFGLIAAAISSIFTAFKSSAFTLAYQEFTDKNLKA